ncbi:MAG: CDP-diacylglycerol--serine O-phosphatidyltransferase [Prevotellaceae bacterium]|jgi:CDP-diacylglycerol--serine O-phosphatidyltransferase|nr:CDP-diacylglycerol--serine O-phosphatidyltransferase [Prevotellaceae bacterium]
MKKYIPNTLTCCNLLCGSVAVMMAANDNYAWTLILILSAAIFDFCDGFFARLLHAYSPLGKELDSLADGVSFGLTPAIVAFSLLKASAWPEWAAYFGLIMVAFAALRLAKFNIDELQSSSFIGLATPANAILWGGIAYSSSAWLTAYPLTVMALVVLCCFLMVCKLPMFALKFKTFGWKGNQWQWLFLTGDVALIIFLRDKAFAPIIIWYLVLSLIMGIISLKNRQRI